MDWRQRKKMLENWVHQYNPKAQLTHADMRCGALYAVTTTDDNGISHLQTSYLTLKELEQFLLGIQYHDDFLGSIKK